MSKKQSFFKHVRDVLHKHFEPEHFERQKERIKQQERDEIKNVEVVDDGRQENPLDEEDP